MFKSIAVVVGSYLLSVVLVLATDPLLSRLFPEDYVQGRIPFQPRSHGEHSVLRCHLDPVCLALCPLCPGPRGAARALVLHPWRSNGYRCNYSQLEQGLAALVLVVLLTYLAGELLDRPATCRSPD